MLARTALTVALLLCAAPVDPVELRFAPEDGSSRTKTFTSSGELTAEDAFVSVSVEGDEFSIEIETRWSRSVEVSDSYGPCADGRPLTLERSFETVALEGDTSLDIEGPQEPFSYELAPSGSSVLEGRTVRFTWDEDQESYRRTYVGEPGPREALAGLSEDMDLRGLLPSEALEEGDTWEPEGEALAGLLLPGGDLALVVEAELDDWEPVAAGVEPWVLTDLGPLLAGELEVELSCTLGELREQDGERLRTVTLKVQVEGEADLEEVMSRRLEEVEDRLPGPAEVDDAVLAWTAEGEGILVWNETLGLAHSLDLTLEATLALDRLVVVDGDGTGIEIETRVELSGELRHTLE